MPLLYIKQSYFIGTRNGVKVSFDFGYVWGKIPPGKRLKWHSEHLDFEIFWGSMPPDPLEARAFGTFAIASVIRKVSLRP